MLGVMALRHRLVDRSELHRRDPQALALEPPEDFAGQTALDSIGLGDDERPIHERARLGQTLLKNRMPPPLPTGPKPRNVSPGHQTVGRSDPPIEVQKGWCPADTETSERQAARPA